MTLAHAIMITEQRRDWLTHRIEAKRAMGWDIEWDVQERDAHTRVLEHLEHLAKGLAA